MNVSTQAILNAKTCAQLSAMMEEVEAMQALIITQYEAIAMTEQQELTMLEEQLDAAQEVEEILYNARVACQVAKDTVNSGEYEKHHIKLEYDNLNVFITALSQYAGANVTLAIKYMKVIQSRLSSIYEDHSATITDAREVYHRASIAHNDMIRMPAKCSVGGFEESECELTLIIDELKALGLAKEAEHCETLHSRMLTTYDAFLMNS